MTRRTSIVATVVAACLLLGACSDDGSQAEGTTAPTDTAPAATTVGGDTTSAEEGDCPEAVTTRDMEECLGDLIDRLDAERETLAASVAEGAAQPDGASPDEPTAAERWTSAEDAFIAYRDTTCDAVHFEYLDGSIRGVEALACQIDLTRGHLTFLEGHNTEG